MDLTTAIAELRKRNEVPPRPQRLPTTAEVAFAEQALRTEFPPDYRRFLLEASDVMFGIHEPSVVTPDAGYLSLERTAHEGWRRGVPRDWLPFCEDNADFYCLVGGMVRFWSHDGVTDESWADLASWIGDVWIDEGDRARAASRDIQRR
jgi:hypothetical protein